MIWVFFTSSKFRTKMVDIEIFNLNEDLLVDYDYDGLDDLEMGPFWGYLTNVWFNDNT